MFQHHILSFYTEYYIYLFLEIFGVHLEHLSMFIVQKFQIYLNLFAIFWFFYSVRTIWVRVQNCFLVQSTTGVDIEYRIDFQNFLK
jgi:hypothetical protein